MKENLIRPAFPEERPRYFVSGYFGHWTVMSRNGDGVDRPVLVFRRRFTALCVASALWTAFCDGDDPAVTWV